MSIDWQAYHDFSEHPLIQHGTTKGLAPRAAAMIIQAAICARLPRAEAEALKLRMRYMNYHAGQGTQPYASIRGQFDSHINDMVDMIDDHLDGKVTVAANHMDDLANSLYNRFRGYFT